MDLDDLRAHVGTALWDQACEWAWKGPVDRLDEGYDENDPANAPHDLETLIWDTEGMSWVQRVALAFELYRAMPCYGNLMFIRYAYDQFSCEDKDAERLFWDEYRSLLSDADDRLADPVAYTLFVDYFEDPETVGETWDQLLKFDGLNDRGLQRVLEESGPVPWHKKAHLFKRLVRDKTWHYWIFRSLVSSTFAGYGDIDLPAAAAVLAQLELPGDTEDLERLRDELKKRLTEQRDQAQGGLELLP